MRVFPEGLVVCKADQRVSRTHLASPPLHLVKNFVGTLASPLTAQTVYLTSNKERLKVAQKPDLRVFEIAAARSS